MHTEKRRVHLSYSINIDPIRDSDRTRAEKLMYQLEGLNVEVRHLRNQFPRLEIWPQV